jgi:hypothetical protein
MLPPELPATGSLSSAISTATDSAGSLPPCHILHTGTPALFPRSLSLCARVGGNGCSNFGYYNPSPSKFDYAISPTLRLFTFTYRNRLPVKVNNLYKINGMWNKWHEIPFTGKEENYALPPCTWKYRNGSTTMKTGHWNWLFGFISLWNINNVVSSGTTSYKFVGT